MNYYLNKKTAYGIGHTRLKRILDVAGDGSGKKVLDVGCGAGKLGEEFKKRGAFVIGSDISSAAIEEARSRLDEAFLVQPGEILPAGFVGGQFDIIVLAEILEHLFEPAAMLIEAGKFLKPDGCIVITIPNFMTWTNRIRFIFGKFAYQKEGMFDFGHIRWFTYSYLKKVLQEAGFKITAENHIIFPGKLTYFLKKWPSVFAWQFVVKVKKI